MTAAEIVSSLAAAGVGLRVVNDRIDLEAASEPPRALLDELTRNRADVLVFLREREAPPEPVRVVDRREPVNGTTPAAVSVVTHYENEVPPCEHWSCNPPHAPFNCPDPGSRPLMAGIPRPSPRLPGPAEALAVRLRQMATWTPPAGWPR